MSKTLYLACLSLSLLLLIVGCKKDSSTGNQTVDPLVKYTAETFNDLYLWYDLMPSVNLASIKTPTEYISKVKYPLDKWSFTMNYTDLFNLLQNGVSTGYGIGLAFDSQNLLRILYVYDNSAMGKAGVKRGWQIKSINSKLVSSMSSSELNWNLANSTNTFEFIKNDGLLVSSSMTRGAIVINTVLYQTIFDRPGKKIGYLVFNEFLDSSVKELNTTFENFSKNGVKDLILDLRYNGGGTLDCADTVVALLAGKLNKDRIYNTLVYNNKHTNLGFTSKISSKSNSLALDKIVVITSSSTASASEVVISGIKPYLNVKLIGSATHGKPVGMNIVGDTKLNLAVAPISFKNVNSQGYTDYYDGIPVDFTVSDNAMQDWGIASDGCLTAALNYISTGSIGYIPTTKSTIVSQKIINEGLEMNTNNLFQLKK